MSIETENAVTEIAEPVAELIEQSGDDAAEPVEEVISEE